MVDGGECWAGGAGGSEEEGTKKSISEALVGVAVGRGDVVENP